MRRMLLLTVLIALPLVTGCKKQLFHLTGTLNVSELFEVNDADGSYQAMETIQPADVNAELDIPDNAVITGVEIETLYFDVALQPGNQAASVSASAWVRPQNGVYVPAFQNITLPLVNGIVNINTLNPAAVAVLKAQLQAVLMQVGTVGPVDVRVELTANRAPVIADIELVVRGTVNYDACLEVPDWLTEGEKCDIEED
ncbi:MAG: hypothetical protein QUS35_11285 [bacterium]|nr:hypothetical protein [bacterium]